MALNYMIKWYIESYAVIQQYYGPSTELYHNVNQVKENLKRSEAMENQWRWRCYLMFGYRVIDFKWKSLAIGRFLCPNVPYDAPGWVVTKTFQQDEIGILFGRTWRKVWKPMLLKKLLNPSMGPHSWNSSKAACRACMADTPHKGKQGNVEPVFFLFTDCM